MTDPRQEKRSALGVKTFGGPQWDSWMGVGFIGGTSATWPSANYAILFPFRLEELALVKQLFWENGAAVSGNVDCGIYSLDGTLIVSTGSTAQSGANTSQVVDITDTLLGPGVYWCALAMDNTTGTMTRSNVTSHALRQYSVMGAASSFPLPSTITLIAHTQNYVADTFGLSFQGVF